MSIQLELDFLSRLVRHPEELSELLSLGITDIYFHDSTFRTVFHFINETRRATGKMPHHETVKVHTGFEAIDPPETVGFYARELIKRATFYEIRDGINNVGELLEKNDVYGALKVLHNAARAGDVQAGHLQKVWTVEETSPRLERYERRKKLGATPEGWPTPWLPFTEETMGWRNGTFNLITARTGVGKTWALILNAHAAWDAGATVLIISMEMSPLALQLRHDAYIAEVPIEHLLKGTLNSVDEARYRDVLDKLKAIGGVGIVGYNMAANMAQLAATIERLKPDIVFIDGLNLVRPSFSGKDQDRHSRLADGADEITMLLNDCNIPGVGILQLGRGHKKSAKEVDVANIYGSDVYGQHASTIYGMLQTREDRKDGVMRYSLVKNRDGSPVAARVLWDLDNMDFTLIEHEVGVTYLKPAEPPPVAWS